MTGDWMWAAAGFALAAVVIGVASVEIEFYVMRYVARRRRRR
jgi:hypothetical protein